MGAENSIKSRALKWTLLVTGGAFTFFLVCYVVYVISHWQTPVAQSSGAFFEGTLINIASNAAWIPVASIAGILGAWILRLVEERTTKAASDAMSIRATGTLDFERLSARLDMAKSGDRFVLIKNWICSSGDALNDKFKIALCGALERGVNVFVFLLHPRSPATLRRGNQIRTDVADKVIKSVAAIQAAAKEFPQGAGTGKLRLFCHDFFSGFELFAHENTDKPLGWVQFALYSGFDVANNCQQMVVEYPHALAQELCHWVDDLVGQVTKGDFKNYEFTEIDLSNPDAIERLNSRPLLIQALDVARALRGLPDVVARKFSADICLQESSLPAVAAGAVPFKNSVEDLYLKAIGTDTVAKSVGIIGIARQHNTAIIEDLLLSTRDGEEFVIFDNWFGGDYGLRVPEIKHALSLALDREVAIKIVFLHPNSVLVDRRLAEIHTSVESIRQTIIDSLKEIAFWVKTWSDTHKKKPNVQVYCHDCTSSLQVLGGTKRCSVGFYLKDVPASEGLQLIVERGLAFGDAIWNHVQYVFKDSGRAMQVKLDEEIAPQFDGILSPIQITEIAELLSQSSAANAARVANAVIKHASHGPQSDGPDRHKTTKITATKTNERQQTLKAFAFALLESFGHLGLKFGHSDYDSLKRLLKSLATELPDVLGVKGNDAKDLKRILKGTPNKDEQKQKPH